MRIPSRHSRPAVSLVEVLVVLGITGLLFSLILAGVQQARESAARVGCANNLRQIGIALHHYHDTHGHLPPGTPTGQDDPNYSLHWLALILPDIGQAALWTAAEAALQINPNPYQNPPHVPAAALVPTFVCANDGRLMTALRDQDGLVATYSSYLGVSGAGPRLDGMLGIRPGISFNQVPDGLSETLLVGERPPPDTLQAGWWYSRLHPTGIWGIAYGPDGELGVEAGTTPGIPCAGPFPFGPGRTDNPCDRFHYWSLHRGGANFAFADGSVHFLSYSAHAILPALATRNGREVIQIP